MADSTFVSLLSRPEFAIFDFAPGETHTISSPDELATARHLVQVLTAHCLDGLGHGVPFDYWITALNPLLRFTDLVNDLTSFSKEILVTVPPDQEGAGGMDINYVTLQTLVRRQARTLSRFGSAADSNLYTYQDGLCEMMNELVQVVREADRAFVEYPRHCSAEQRRLWKMDEAARAWMAYKNGFIRMHIDAPRWSSEGLRVAVRDRDAWVRLKDEIYS
ncbi:hypothetical protein OQA88_620 [Cercophora sp. LCS_1]